MKRMIAVIAMATVVLAAPAAAHAWSTAGNTAQVTAFALVRSEGGVMYTPISYTLDPSTCPRIEQRDSGFADGVAYLGDTGASFGDLGFDNPSPQVGDSLSAILIPDANYTAGDEFCIPMLGPLPTVDINGVSITEGTAVLASTRLRSNVVTKSVTFKLRTNLSGTQYTHNTVRIYNAAGKLVASSDHLGLGIKLVTSLVKGRTYKAVFKSSGYMHSKTASRKLTVQ